MAPLRRNQSSSIISPPSPPARGLLANLLNHPNRKKISISNPRLKSQKLDRRIRCQLQSENVAYKLRFVSAIVFHTLVDFLSLGQSSVYFDRFILHSNDSVQ